MRKTILILVLIAVSSVSLWAEGTEEWPMEYINLSFANSTIKQKGLADINNRFGVGFTVVKTYNIGPAIADMVRFGVEATWFDVNYSNYKVKDVVDEFDDYSLHQGEVSMHVGPSATFTPMKRLFFHAYFQYCPTFACIYTTDTENFYGNYASMWVGGGSVTFGPVGLGFEKRWGSVNYKAIKPNDAEPWKASLTGWRAYIAFRF